MAVLVLSDQLLLQTGSTNRMASVPNLLGRTVWKLNILLILFVGLRQASNQPLGHSLHVDDRLRQAVKPVPVDFMYDHETGTSWAVPAASPNTTNIYIPPEYIYSHGLPGFDLQGVNTQEGLVLDINYAMCPPEATELAPQTFPLFLSYSASLTKDVAALDALPEVNGYDIIWYGDSITEYWKGTAWGVAIDAHVTVPFIYFKYFASKYDSTLNLAVSGDQVENQQWRLEQSQIPTKPIKLIINLIGTNDLGSVACAQPKPVDSAVLASYAAPILARIKNQTKYLLRKHHGTKVLLQGLLPRSALSLSTYYDWPNAYTEAIELINEGLRQYAQAHKRVFYIYCGEFALNPNKDGLDPLLMSDALHPTFKGYVRMAECLAPEVDRLLA
eukprot:jgi/Botrbrau1/15843/Bobra.40_1s0027.1